MHLAIALSFRFLALGAVLGAYVPDQLPLITEFRTGNIQSLPWNVRLSEDATGNLVFQSLASLMQMRPNARYPYGHSIVRAHIPPGTVLYHGRGSDAFPEADWIAFDPEHSQVFARGDNGTLFTFATTRDLKLVYFDGCSADKAAGVDDTQDVLIWGHLGDHSTKGPGRGEHQRLIDACDWAKEYDVDGFVRMEMDFEIMYCDFTQGLELVSALNIINPGRGGPGPGRRPGGEQPYGGHGGPMHGLLGGPDGPMHGPQDGPNGPGRGSPSTVPNGWKGGFPVVHSAVAHAGSWHGPFPGDLRVRVEPSAMLTFFDPAFTSLVEARRGLTRQQYRLQNISSADVARAREDISDMFSRGQYERSGVDWRGLAQTVQDRFAERLPFLRYLLHQPTQNASAQAEAVRQQLIISLIPYIPRAGVGESTWFAETAHGCRASFTSHLPVSRFTKQEHVLRNALDEVLHEICRVLTGAWSGAFDIEEKSAGVAAEMLAKWKTEVDSLVQWLDWPVWMGCEPGCAINEFCYVPQPHFGRRPDEEIDTTPRCIAWAPASP
ncbi:uncharacterized protein B0H18DRAFT_1004272 [Fomitopsis serialis]|uniref:uncharacterized protein n=1 Tax=Fomitopsis serialis TaxID=139415 RepID=UPI0020074EA8|nr:uncharacterized protein B0H18DRAFT_1004272 [Neoantrodia serialis]KAH9926865.1 hypothetical protein B0H18DRAFT_1004272 [Neoantrodia serialis]